MTFHPGFAKFMEGVQVKDKSVLDIGYQTNTSGKGSVEDWYKARGAVNYLALDLVEKHGAVYADLNYPVENISADIVCNNGTSEHLFNQAQVFKTIHECARETIVHCLPFTPWINHGFFNYNPTLFFDLAFTNDYELTRMRLHNRWGDGEDCREGFPERAEKIKSLQKGDVFISVVFVKKSDAEFKYPIQGVYRDRIKKP